MAVAACPDVTVHVCCNCVPQARSLPRQWTQDGMHVLVRQVPCSGKIDLNYLLHGLEGGGRGVVVVACRRGECSLAQGNYRAEIRIRTIQRLLEEIGLDPNRAQLLHFSPDAEPGEFEPLVRRTVEQICACGETFSRGLS